MSKWLVKLKDAFDIRQELAVSSLGMKYSKFRDHPLHSGHTWLEAKRDTDGADGLWRVHDGLYDLGSFVDSHPGGSEWLEMTKGTDITEAFETHHLNPKVEAILKKYFVRKATTKRNSPFTFKDGDFYKVLKRNISEALKDIPESAASRSKVLTDAILGTYIILSILSIHAESYLIGIFAGIFLGLTAIASHNFFHQRNNFRMYYFDFTMMHYKEWRVSHALSHHGYTNTIDDLEISAIEPFLQYLPRKKHFVFRYLSWFYSPVVYAFLFIGHFIRTIIQYTVLGKGFHIAQTLPFLLLGVMMLVSRNPTDAITMFMWITIIGSIHFAVVGLNAAHHHPDIFHDGDAPRPIDQRDWGVFQMDAVMDRRDITGSHFLVLTNFGDHTLHHLFPTIDHGKLEYLYPIFLKTCKEFGMEWRLSSQLELVKGQFLQLAKNKGSREAKVLCLNGSGIKRC